jgi:hypothetical protein
VKQAETSCIASTRQGSLVRIQYHPSSFRGTSCCASGIVQSTHVAQTSMRGFVWARIRLCMCPTSSSLSLIGKCVKEESLRLSTFGERVTDGRMVAIREVQLCVDRIVGTGNPRGPLRPCATSMRLWTRLQKCRRNCARGVGLLRRRGGTDALWSGRGSVYRESCRILIDDGRAKRCELRFGATQHAAAF